jgi:hypothetical protein
MNRAAGLAAMVVRGVATAAFGVEMAAFEVGFLGEGFQVADCQAADSPAAAFVVAKVDFGVAIRGEASRAAGFRAGASILPT